MPDREVKTIRDLIYFQYAKIIAKSAFGEDAKKTSYGFIKKVFRDLVHDEKKWSDILREDKQLVEGDRVCAYCGSTEGLQWEHIVPRSLKINDRCPACERIQGIHNQVLACRKCNSSKSSSGLYHFIFSLYPGEKRNSDKVPALVEKKYLKTIYYCHICNGTINAEGDFTVLDLDF